ncbi:hypothetical protein MKZ38_002192 [Zalerion maritima]|uniref:Uncharacterized protein n=1 Tax=Zalerion maritima TaxID=339359 RepID=A0AAD5RPY7_9PEZI|nr:hypothetical protein MKZ38_002192 [Zalerion maritima]
MSNKPQQVTDEELDREWKPNGRRPQSTLARSFSAELMDIFKIDEGVAELDKKVDKSALLAPLFVHSLEIALAAHHIQPCPVRELMVGGTFGPAIRTTTTDRIATLIIGNPKIIKEPNANNAVSFITNRKQTISMQTNELQSLEQRLREMEERLKAAGTSTTTSSNTSSPPQHQRRPEGAPPPPAKDGQYSKRVPATLNLVERGGRPQRPVGGYMPPTPGASEGIFA